MSETGTLTAPARWSSPTPASLRAWHGDPVLKDAVVERMRAHRGEDSIIQGVYQELAPSLATGYRGCLIGCTLPPSSTGLGWHRRVEEQYGIPRAVAHLLDQVFEGLPPANCAEFAVAAVEAVTAGADLSMVASQTLLDSLDDAVALAPYASRPAVRDVVGEVVAHRVLQQLRDAPVVGGDAA